MRFFKFERQARELESRIATLEIVNDAQVLAVERLTVERDAVLAVLRAIQPIVSAAIHVGYTNVPEAKTLDPLYARLRELGIEL